ncbi:hypothetical protein TNCV_2360921 [Trichonephila clavipes]|nr:hypothetical protein TNCV_2360921 [Trichonephila clavipes]
MRARVYCVHPSIRYHWALRCMSRCPHQVVSLCEARHPVFKSPSKLGTHLSTHCSRGERLSRPFPARERNLDLRCGSAIRYHSTAGLGFVSSTMLIAINSL